MIIIIHQVNTIEKLQSVPCEYGVEVDVRAMGHRVVLNHEPYEDGEELEEYMKHYKHSFIIFHIKESGIQYHIINLMEKLGINDYFLLDIEYPFMYQMSKDGFSKQAVRFSESVPVEYALAHSRLVDWVYVDVTTMVPLNLDIYNKLKNAGFKICLVCPSVIGRLYDVERYRHFLNNNNMKLDAIMTELENVNKWC